MAQPVAVLDANVLVPILVCDLLLTLFAADLYRPAISPDILDEVERNLVENFLHLDPAALRRRIGQMAEALALNTHHVSDVVDVDLTGANPKDRHVVQLAIAQRADLVVTSDRKLRREINALGRRLHALTADDFAVQLVNDHRDRVEEVIEQLVAKRTRRPVSRGELIESMSGSLPAFAARLRTRT